MAPPPPLVLHSPTCGDSLCRPGQGNLVGYEHWKMPVGLQEHWQSLNESRGVAHKPDPESSHYMPLVLAARRVASHNLVVMAAADVDYRFLAVNWHRSTTRSGMDNALVYCLDKELYAYLLERAVPCFNGTDNMLGWVATRLKRHLQHVEAEKFTAATALAAAGLDVLLTDVSHVFLHNPLPFLKEHTHGVEMAIGRGPCTGRAPVGCALWWNFFWLNGAGGERHNAAERRARIVAFNEAAIAKGMVDFYLRWWNGHHCMFQGYGKLFDSAGPRLESPTGLTPQTLASSAELTALVAFTPSQLTCGAAAASEGCLRIALLPTAQFPPPFAGAYRSANTTALVGRSQRPDRGHRLNLDRYDERDFEILRDAMIEDGLWLLDGKDEGRGRALL